MTAPQSPYRPLPPPPRPVAPRWKGAAAAAALFAALAGFTSHKLVVISRLRGWQPGCPERVMEAGDTLRRLGPDTRVLALRDPAQPGARPYEIQVRLWQLPRFRVGTLVRVRCLEDERECFAPGSLCLRDDNVMFDLGLLLWELVGLLVALARLAPGLWSYARAMRAYRAGRAA